MSIRESILQCRSTIVTVHGIAITCCVTAMTWHRQAGLSHPSRNRVAPCFALFSSTVVVCCFELKTMRLVQSISVALSVSNCDGDKFSVWYICCSTHCLTVSWFVSVFVSVSDILCWSIHYDCSLFSLYMIYYGSVSRDNSAGPSKTQPVTGYPDTTRVQGGCGRGVGLTLLRYLDVVFKVFENRFCADVILFTPTSCFISCLWDNC